MVDGEGKLPPAVPAATGGWLSASTGIALVIVAIYPPFVYAFIRPAMSIGMMEFSLLYYALVVGVGNLVTPYGFCRQAKVEMTRTCLTTLLR